VRNPQQGLGLAEDPDPRVDARHDHVGGPEFRRDVVRLAVVRVVEPAPPQRSGRWSATPKGRSGRTGGAAAAPDRGCSCRGSAAPWGSRGVCSHRIRPHSRPRSRRSARPPCRR
jgi:hypothetical protein